MEECTLAPTREESLNPAGIALMVIMGVLFSVAPRTGWGSSANGLDHFTCTFLTTFVVTGITFVARGRAADDHSRSGSVRCRDAHSSGQCLEQKGCPAESLGEDGGIRDAADAGADVAAQESAAGAPGRAAAQSAPADEDDPVWNADWTTLVQSCTEPEPKQAAEVFALNDTPTWLARLQQRRDQAERAGKRKLVQKIDREMAEAQRASGPPRGNAVPSALQGSAESGGSGQDDVWSMDWAAWVPDSQRMQAVAAA